MFVSKSFLGEIMQKMRICIKFMVCALIAIIITGVFLYLKSDIKRVVTISPGNFVASGYTLKDNSYVKVQSDAQIQMNDLNTFIETLRIKLKEPAQKNLKFTLYYAYNGNVFARDLQKEIIIRKGETSGEIILNQKPYSLRFDLDEKVGTYLKIDYFQIKNGIGVLGTGIYLEQMKIITPLIFFLLLPIFFPWKKIKEIMFEKRIWIGIILLFYFVINQYNYSSINQFSGLIQKNIQTTYTSPILGTAKEIRSDEWNVSTPNRLSAQYNKYGKINTILMATDTPNMAASGMHKSYAALARPETWMYYFTNSEYGISFQWNFILIFGFLANFELFLILTQYNKLVSLMGACMLMFSSLFQWFSQMEFIWITPMFLVGVYYFWKEKSSWKRMLWGGIVAISAARFVVMLYPAFQIPVGLFILMVFVSFTYRNLEQIKAFRKADWLIFAITVLFSISIIGYTLYDMKDYILAIQNTVYPGARVSTGGMRIQNIFNYIQSIKYPYIDVGNATEKSTIMNFFPIPILASIVLFVRKKKIDKLMLTFILYCVFILIYTTIGIPTFLAKITLFSMTTDIRAVQIIAYIQVFLLTYVISEQKKESYITWYEGSVMAVITVFLSLWQLNLYDEKYNSGKYMLCAGIVLGVVGFFLIYQQNKRLSKIAICIVIAVTLMIGVPVNPINKGLGSIYDKPVEKEVRKLVKKDPTAVWLAVASYPSVLVANGARTINSVNYMPNMKFWESFSKNETITPDIYNRYAYLDVSLVQGDSVLSLYQPDVLHLDLSYRDLKKKNIKYIQTLDELKLSPLWKIKQIYNDSNAYIYEIE